MLEIKADLSKSKKLIAKLQAYMKPEAISKAIGLRLLRFIDQNFREEGKLIDPSGWKPLKESTIARRRKGSSRILQDTGNLKRSFDAFGYVVGPGKVTVGTKTIYASTHQFGTAGKGIPARPMLPEGSRAASIVRPMLEEALKRAAQNARN